MPLIDRQMLAARRLARADDRRQRRQTARRVATAVAAPVCAAPRADVGRVVARAILIAGRGEVLAMRVLKDAGMKPAEITATIHELRRDIAAAQQGRKS